MPTDADDEPRAAGLWARAVPIALGVVVLSWVTKVIAVAVALVGPGLLGHSVAGRPGVLAAITVGAAITVAACYVAVTRTGDGAFVVHEIGAESMIWVTAGWTIAAGWLTGDTISSAGAVVGLLLAVVLVGVAGLVAWSKLDGGLVATLRRRAAHQ